MDTIVSQIKEVVGKADATAKENMLDVLENLLVELREPMDVLYSTYGAVCLHFPKYGCKAGRVT
jgi:demethylsterigmatocystin 6-O-methyltransferase